MATRSNRGGMASLRGNEEVVAVFCYHETLVQEDTSWSSRQRTPHGVSTSFTDSGEPSYPQSPGWKVTKGVAPVIRSPGAVALIANFPEVPG